MECGYYFIAVENVILYNEVHGTSIVTFCENTNVHHLHSCLVLYYLLSEHVESGTKAVSYEEFFPRNFGVGGVTKFPWKISSGAQSEDLGPSLTIQEFFSRKYSWFYM